MTRAGMPGSMLARCCAALLVVLLALSSLATVAAARRVRQPVQVRIEGFFAGAPEGVRPIRTVEVRIGREAKRQLAIRRFVNLGSGPHGVTILDEAARHRPSLRLTGDRALQARLEAAPDGRLVTITGNLTSGRHVMLSLVEVAPEGSVRAEPEPAPSAAATPG